MRLFWYVYTLELRAAFAYRADFWMRFLGLLFGNVAIAYFLWKAIYAQGGGAAQFGFSFDAMIFYYIMVPLIENVTRPADRNQLSNQIYSGGLTRYLVYPMSFFPNKYAGILATASVALVQLTVLLGLGGLIHGFPAETPVTWTTVGMTACAGLLASLLNFAMVSVIEMVAFWADSVWSLNVMLMFCIRLLGGAMLPLSLFPSVVQAALKYTPFPYMVSFPVLTLLGKVPQRDWLQGLGVTALWVVGFSTLVLLIWRRGLRTYTGVGI